MKKQTLKSQRAEDAVHASHPMLIGRQPELAQMRACLKAKKNVLLEGPVGVGKTLLALEMTQALGVPVFRVDGDSRYSEQKLSGWFDPPSVVKKGFSSDTFMAGPLVEAMRAGGVLFINELNRLPEGVQNVLLPAIDERLIVVPRLGEIRAADGFLVVATQNPKEFVATSHLSEAILDRFELIALDYQSESDEVEIVNQRLGADAGLSGEWKNLPLASVKLVRMTRSHSRIRRGASVRAAISMAEIAQIFSLDGMSFQEAFLQSACLALPTRIEWERDAESELSARAELQVLLREWVDSILAEFSNPSLKKKT
jgi:MoxR-like ATPase